MGLTSSLLIGRSALQASQTAIQVTGNNVANAATPGYHRQQIYMDPVRGAGVGLEIVGRGVSVADVRRAIDPSIQARMRNAMGDEAAAATRSRVLDSIEGLTGELTDNDLSSALSSFFNSWSELANTPTNAATRAAVVEEGATLAGHIRGLREDLIAQRNQVDTELETAVERTNTLLEEIASLNRAVVNGEVGVSEDGNLRDQRDQLVDELSGMMDIQVIERETGAVDILVDSSPLVLGTSSLGLQFQVRTRIDSATGEPYTQARVLSTDDAETIRVTGGSIGGLLEQRTGTVERTIEDLDEVASTLIFRVNVAHSSGRPGIGVSSLASERLFAAGDTALSFNDPTNVTMSELPFSVSNGSFTVKVTDENGSSASETVEVDLDGIRASDGAPGVDEDMTLEDLRDALNGMANLNAEITGGGQLRVWTDSGYEVSFGEDTSGVLAAVGINTYFTGKDAQDIALRSEVREEPGLLVSGLDIGDNGVAMAIAALRDEPLNELGGRSIADRWQEGVERTAVESRAARTTLEAERAVRQNLEAQERAVGGVSLDEESMNLILYQQQYNGAARFIAAVDEMTQLLMSLV